MPTPTETWRDIAASEVLPEAPLTSELAQTWANNVIAAYQGATGAPRQAHRVFSVDGGTGGVAITAGDLGVEFDGVFDVSGGASDGLYLQMSDDAGTTWSTAFELLPVESSATNNGYTVKGFVDFTTGAVVSHYIGISNGDVDDTSGTATLPTGTVNRIRFDAGGESANFILKANGGMI